MSLMERTTGSGGYWLAAGLVSLCMTSCGDSSDEPESAATSVEAATSSATEPVTTSRSTSTLAPTTSTSAMPTPSATEPVTTAVATTTTEPATTTTATPSTSDVPEFPAARVSFEHGGLTWAVVLAGSPDFDDPVLSQAVAAAEIGGYSTGSTDCDVGASEALGFPANDQVYTVSVYLENESDAQLALVAFRSHGIDGVVVEVMTFCFD